MIRNVLCLFFQIVEPNVAVLGPKIVPATYQTEGSVLCTLPDITEFTLFTAQTEFVAIHYQLSVSNDGINFGTPVGHVVYKGPKNSDMCVQCIDDGSPVRPNACQLQVSPTLGELFITIL